MAQLLGLLGNGVHPVLIAVAQGGDADAAGKVDILPALGVIELGAPAVVDGHIKAAVGVHNVLAGEGLHFLGSHTLSSFFSMVPMP